MWLNLGSLICGMHLIFFVVFCGNSGKSTYQSQHFFILSMQ
jgi:hypothetical protein